MTRASSTGTGLRARQRADESSAPLDDLARTCTGITCGLPFFTPIYVPGHRVEIASGPNGVMPHDQGDPRVFAAPFFPTSVRRARRSGDDARAARGVRIVQSDQLPSATSRSRWRGSITDRCTATGSSAAASRSCTRRTPSTSRSSDAQAARRRHRHPDLRRAVHARRYPAKVGWGHSTWEVAHGARAAGVPQLVLFHHDPNRTDAARAAWSRPRARRCPGPVAAREGLDVARDAGYGGRVMRLCWRSR